MRLLVASAIAAVLALSPSAAWSQEKLFLYNWTDYTSPEAIKKFEAETGIKVTIDTYDSNETLLAKLKAGATGYDVIIPSNNFVPIFIDEKLVQKYDVKSLPNFANVEDRWKSPEWDKNQEYTAPFQWGTTSVAYREDLYGKKLESLGEYFKPSGKAAGRVSVFKTPEEIVNLAHLYLGQKFCNPDPAQMQKVQDLLLEQKPAVNTYSSEGMNDRLINGDSVISAHWNGYALKGRTEGAKSGKIVAYAYPKEGVIGWMDNMMIPTTAGNVENAKKFINFMMAPENMALQANFTGYAAGIKGMEASLTEEMRTAPEINAPADAKIIFSWACDAQSQKLIDKVWTNVLK
ncbi:extracellular solute-binding protein [Nordella sp. HKS 07]|uniref:extracellular solute-binding protein n=1 Tax=Nordella sp. HKS 07 TaxID=2712222 RepID=UPI0013E1A38A|nr:extracellular solute-binding protein [Nordella sp. HKS 07]QIG51879.1 extracellular solute-binding protein [Nordella sp. HKS 07]